MSEKCCLKPVNTNSNPGNVYNHNFKGKYCFCDQEYDDNAEDGSMVQCYACEDWFHDKCIKNVCSNIFYMWYLLLTQGLEEGSFETFICKTCVGSNTFLNSYRGLKEFQFVSELGDFHIDILDSTDEKIGPKRCNQDEELERTTKKLKTDDAVVESNTSIEQPSYKCMISSSSTNYEPCNLFLLENWKTKLCKCDSCCTLYSVNGLYYFLLSEEEDIVKCEEEISDGQDEESSVIAQLASVDRVRTMNGVLAFNDLKSELMDFLRGFAGIYCYVVFDFLIVLETNQIVSERDIKSFFDKKEKDRRNI